MAVIPKKTYPGRKGAAGTWQKIISEIPRCEMFIDAMAGSGLISSLVPNCKLILNDIDPLTLDKIQFTESVDIEKWNEDYRIIITEFNNGSPYRVFYFDPPYKMETRSYKKPIYRHEWNDENHYDFLMEVSKMSCPVMVSHYPCELYDKFLKEWRQIEYNTMTRAGLRKEKLYMNFPQPVLLQCPGSIGENFTDRQRIKRKVNRILKKLEKEKPQERAAILSSIIDGFSYMVPGSSKIT